MRPAAIRPARPDDAPAIARVLRASQRGAMPRLPALHTPEEDLRFVAGHVLPGAAVWVAEEDGAVLGFVARRGAWVEHLYLDLARRRGGLGTALLLVARAGMPTLRLWVFQRNDAARAFYARHGFRAAEFTDGRGNEEREPDLRMEWTADVLPQPTKEEAP